MRDYGHKQFRICYLNNYTRRRQKKISNKTIPQGIPGGIVTVGFWLKFFDIPAEKKTTKFKL